MVLALSLPNFTSPVYIEMTFAVSFARASHLEFYSLPLFLTISYYTSLFASLIFPYGALISVNSLIQGLVSIHSSVQCSLRDLSGYDILYIVLKH